MLVLTRKVGESILIGRDIRVRVMASSGKNARLAIEAPDGVTILREEVYDRIAQANREAAVSASDANALANFRVDRSGDREG